MHNAMRAIPVVIIALLALSGCDDTAPWRGDAPSGSSDPDGVSCEDSAGEDAVRIDIEYSGTEVSTPSVVCEVDRGTRITWRAPAASRDGFQLRFHEASPGGPRASRMVTSTDSDGRQKIRITADNDSGEYHYDILTRDGGIDPAIIIRFE